MVNHNKKALALTIVIPAYNEESNLPACLDSIADQEVMPDKVLVIDNNSTDETARIAASYDFVEVIKEKNQGIAYARNRGFNEVRSGIIARIDADTTLPPIWVKDIKRFYGSAVNHDKVLTGSGYFSNLVVPPKSITAAVHSLIAFRFNRLILGHYILWGSNMAMTVNQWKAVKDHVCYDGDIHEDLDLAIHLHRKGFNIHYDRSIRVGVVMRRVLDKWSSLYSNMMWWPKTLKRHQNKRWILGLVGAYFLLAGSTLVFLVNKPPTLIRKLAQPKSRLNLGKIFLDW